MNNFRAKDIISWTSSSELPYIRGQLAKQKTDLCALPHELSDSVYSAVSTDSRSLKPGQVFVALTGTSFDGHSFLLQAAELGAGMLIAKSGHPELEKLKLDMPELLFLNLAQPSSMVPVENSIRQLGTPIVLEVPDTLWALQQIACGYRHQLKAKVIAVTGSVGKTSTREMISCCLSVGGNVHQTTANLNNEIGLPQTLLAADREHDFVVVEMGMRGLGQIELLSRIACPDISVITNIGWSHLELLGSRENILKAKTEIIAGMSDNSVLIINQDDELLSAWKKQGHSPVKTVGYSVYAELRDQTMRDIWAENIFSDSQSTSFEAVTEDNRCNVRINLPGQHHVSNALAGLLVARLAGVEMEAAAMHILNYRNTGLRQRILRLKGVCIMDDTYNAAPESMITAIKTISDMASGQRVIGVLAGMLELGNYSEAAHQLVGRAAAEAGFSELCLFGDDSAQIEIGSRQVSSDIIVSYYDSHDKLAEYLKSIIRPGDYILVKGSRAFAMDKITAELEAFLEG